MHGNAEQQYARILPIIILAVGQAIVILGGGIDISVGGDRFDREHVLATGSDWKASPEADVAISCFISLLAGVLAGAINGFFIAYLRLQPIITTYATSFLYAGFALFILPNPGGGIPRAIANFTATPLPLGLPLAFYVIAVILLIWLYIRSTRYGKYLYRSGRQSAGCL